MKLAVVLVLVVLLISVGASAKTIIIESRGGSSGGPSTGENNETLYDASQCDTTCTTYYEVFGI